MGNGQALPSGEPGPGNRATLVVALALIVAYSLSVAGIAHDSDTVADEQNYFNAGRLVRKGHWDLPETRQHGPISYYASQLFVGDEGAGTYDPLAPDRALFVRGRLGTLPFGILAGVLVFLWSRRAFGNAGALVSLTLYALNPLLIGYGAYVLVDVVLSAAVLLVVFLLWKYFQHASWPRALALGVALGIAFATKFIALLVALPVALMAGARAYRARARPGRAALHAVGVCALLTVTSILALHACYGFRGGLAERDPAAYKSELVSQLIEMPVAGDLITLLPAPFLLGVDSQKRKAEGSYSLYLNGVFASGHWDYFLWTFLLKTPEVVLALTLWLLLFQVPEWVRGRGGLEGRATLWAIAPVALVVLVYLSFLTAKQFGARYIVPLYPLLFVLLGSSGARLAKRFSGRAVWAAFAVLAAAHTWDLRVSWPNLIAYYNHAAGGQGSAYLHFRKSNSDYGQFRERGLRILEETESEPFVVLGDRSGPRFGRVAASIQMLDRVEPGRRTRARFDWLETIPPVRHVGACWWLFDVTPRVLEDAVRDDVALRGDLVIAYLGAGDAALAARHLAHMPAEVAEPLARLRDLGERAQSPAAARQTIEALARMWITVGRSDLALDLTDRAPRLLEEPPFVADVAAGLAQEGARQRALELLGGVRMETSWHVTRALVEIHLRANDYDRVVELLERFLDLTGDGRARRYLDRVSDRAERYRRFFDELRVTEGAD